jgi:uncharacterized phage-associated protein
MARPYRPMAVANNFIRRFGYRQGITHLKLQKLVYYVHGWWLAYNPSNPPLLTERPEVWRHGPVFPNIYNALKNFGSRPIRLPQPDLPLSPPADIGEDDDQALNLVDWVWVRYGAYSAIQLSNMTHEPGTPWRQLAERYQYRVPAHLQIPDELISQK